MEHKHAYLIMAHNEFSIVKELLKELDDVRNDIFLHIDAKVKNVSKEEFMQCVECGRLFFIDRINVNWGGYSQIRCELSLLQNAINQGNYLYYHLLTGVNFPLKDQDVIHDFFDKNQGKEFIGFDTSKEYSDRAIYYHLFNEIGKDTNFIKHQMYRLRSIFIRVQKIFCFKRRLPNELKIYKGFVYWSITQRAAEYICSQKKLIKKLCKYSLCGDEIFVQTVIGNSDLMRNVYKTDDEFRGCMREVPWYFGDEKHRDNVWLLSDLDVLLNSDKLYAMKFSGEEGLKLIRRIKKDKTGRSQNL